MLTDEFSRRTPRPRDGWRLATCLGIGVLVIVGCSGKKRPFGELSGSPIDASVAAPDQNESSGPAPSAPADGMSSRPDAATSENISPAPLPPAAAVPTSACEDADAGACTAPCEGCAPLDLGELCSGASDCASGFCAPATDGVSRCCDQACTGVECLRCSVEGTCDGTPAFAEECGEVTCPPDDVCRDYEAIIPAGSCTASGCATAAGCGYQWTEAARDGAACECADSSCALIDGETCTRDDDCSTGACRASLGAGNVCCAQPCGPDQVCRDDGTGCELAPVCTDGQERCSGSSFQRCTGGQWATERECGPLGCDTTLAGCRRSAGQPCTSSSECGEGACRQAANGSSICCTAACDAACRVCASTGTSCQFLADDSACGVIACPGDSTCRDYPPSVTTNRCRNGSCGAPELLCGFTPRNAGQSCSATALCDDGGDCDVPKSGLGSACAAAAECASNNCVDGVCCESACNGPCMACSPANGRCSVVPADDPSCPIVQCGSGSECAQSQDITSNRCLALGQCKGTAQCSETPAALGTACESTESAHRRCDGNGNCADPTVICGLASCAIDDDTTCCYRGSAAAVTPVCTTRANCTQQQFELASAVDCDNVTDCQTGEVCCHLTATTAAIFCSAPSSCVNSPVSSAFPICESPGQPVGLSLQRFSGFTCR